MKSPTIEHARAEQLACAAYIETNGWDEGAALGMSDYFAEEFIMEQERKVKRPLMIELFYGTGGWGAGWLELGGRVIGFDIEHLPHHGPVPENASLVLQDVLTLHGSQFKDADLICCSPPCQAYSYMFQPWSKAKAIQLEYENGTRNVEDLNALFKACFRIWSEAMDAKGCFIPMVVENVVGAQRWVGTAAAHYGSYYLWGSVGMIGDRVIAGPLTGGSVEYARKFGILDPGIRAAKSGVKVGGFSWSDFGKPDYKALAFNGQAAKGQKTSGHVNKRDGHTHTRHLTNQAESDAVKQGGNWWHDPNSMTRQHSSKSPARKAASARIARIPPALSRYIAQAYYPKDRK